MCGIRTLLYIKYIYLSELLERRLQRTYAQETILYKTALVGKDRQNSLPPSFRHFADISYWVNQLASVNFLPLFWKMDAHTVRKATWSMKRQSTEGISPSFLILSPSINVLLREGTALAPFMLVLQCQYLDINSVKVSQYCTTCTGIIFHNIANSSYASHCFC